MWELTLLSLGKLRSWINRNWPGTFLGTRGESTTPTGEGCLKGPAATSWTSLAVTK